MTRKLLSLEEKLKTLKQTFNHREEWSEEEFLISQKGCEIMQTSVLRVTLKLLIVTSINSRISSSPKKKTIT